MVKATVALRLSNRLNFFSFLLNSIKNLLLVSSIEFLIAFLQPNNKQKEVCKK